MLFFSSPTLTPAARHGFSTRQGSISRGRYASLNLGAKWGDDPACVAENRRRLAAAAGFDLDQLCTVRQVHSAEVATITSEAPATFLTLEADALVSTTPNTVLGVYTADCVPILFSDGEGRIGAAHAGWRGTVQNIATRTVEALERLGAHRSKLRAALGPSICVRCFEVGEEVAAEFERLAPLSVERSGAKPHVDLWQANRTLLLAAGLSPEQIDAQPPCTACDPTRFFSYRRDGSHIGQHLSFIAAA